MEVLRYLVEVTARKSSEFQLLRLHHSYMGLPQVNNKSWQELEYKTLLAIDV